jgi:hypothetical protein
VVGGFLHFAISEAGRESWLCTSRFQISSKACGETILAWFRRGTVAIVESIDDLPSTKSRGWLDLDLVSELLQSFARSRGQASFDGYVEATIKPPSWCVQRSLGILA